MAGKIKILGLFNDHDIELDFNNDINVLIGENGIGKSSILKIIKSFVINDFIELARFVFHKIILINDASEVVYEVEHNWLVPNANDILSHFQFEYGSLKEEDLDSFPAKTQYWTDFSLFRKAFIQLEDHNKELFSQYVSACFFAIPISKRIVNANKQAEFLLPTSAFNPVKHISKVIESLRNVYEFNGFNRKPFRYINRSKISLSVMDNECGRTIFSNQLVNKRESIHLLDMSINYHLCNDVNSQPVLYSNELIWAEYYGEVHRGNSRMNMKNIRSEDDTFSTLLNSVVYGHKNLIGCDSGPAQLQNAIIDLKRSIYDNIHYMPYDVHKERQSVIHKMLQDNVVNINMAITYFYYDEEFLKRINDKAIEFSRKIIGQESVIQRFIDFDGMGKEVVNNILMYYRPILVEGSLFSEAMTSITNQGLENDYHNMILIKKFMQFYTDTIDDMKKSKSAAISTLENVLNEFITGKRFVFYPSGVTVYLRKFIEKSKGNFIEIINDSDEILLSELSSGERKLLIMLTLILLCPENTYLIDEPEVSISIMWQEKLLPTIIKHTSKRSLIVATHSPYILSDPSIMCNVIALPQEEQLT